MTTEQRINALEKSVRRQRMINTVLLLVVVVMATMAAAPQNKDAEFDTIRAKSLLIENTAGKIQAMLYSNEDGGMLSIENAEGKTQAMLFPASTGGMLSIYNKTGESVVRAFADEYGNGVVYAGNRKSMGRTLKPGN